MSRKKKAHSKSRSPAAEPVTVRPSSRRALAILLAIYLAVGLIVVLVVPDHSRTSDPRLTPPDESAHWQMVGEIATQGHLPAFSEGGGNYEAHQPPLYYISLLGARLLFGNGGVLWARLWGLLLSAGTLIFAWKALPYLLGDDYWARVAAVGAIAFIPGRLLVVASVSNDPMFEMWAALVLWLSLRAANRGTDLRSAAILGLAVGCALLTKTSGLVLIPVAGLALTMEPRWKSVGAKALLANYLAAGILCAAVWGWWVARNMVLYGEPLALNIFQEIFLKDRATPEYFLGIGMSWSGYWMLVAWQSWMSLWGVFGQATIYMPRAFYLLGDLLGGACAIGLVAHWWRWRGAGRPDPQAGSGPWLLAALALLLTMATFLRFNTVFYQAQARYFLGADVVMAAIFVLGISGLSARRVGPWLLAPVAVLLCMTLWAISAYLTGGYTFTPPMPG